MNIMECSVAVTIKRSVVRITTQRDLRNIVPSENKQETMGFTT